MKFLNLQTIFFRHFIKLFFKILNHSLFFSQLLIFIVNYSLKSFDGLLCSLCNSGIFLFVVSLNLFLTIEESSGVIFELAWSELGLHDKGVGRDVHLTSKINEFVEVGFWYKIFNWRFKVINLLFFFHKLLFKFCYFIKQSFSILFIVIVRIVEESNWVGFRLNELGDVVEIVLVEVGILFVYVLVLLFLLVEVIDCSDLFLLGFVGFPLELFHEFYLIRKSFPPELFPLIILDFPIGEFLFQFPNILIVSVVNPQVILFFFL